MTASAERIGAMMIRGVECQYDTLIHRHVGPGVTYTQFQFDNMPLGGSIPYRMRTHLFTIDMTNPYNRLSPYMAEDTYYECATQEQEVVRQKKEGLKPFASVNGFDFVQSPPSISEPYSYMESRYHLVNEGLIRYENNTTSMRYYTDASKKGHVDYLTMKAKVTSSKGASAEIGQINHHRDMARKSNTLALFCNNMDKAKDTNPDDGIEVFLTGNEIRVGTNLLEVAKKEKGCGARIDKGQHVITGVGTEMESFLNSLEKGETITIEISYTDAAGAEVLPSNTYTSFIANCVRNGVAYGDPRTNVAYSATGVSKDGNTVYLAALEISEYSDAPLRCLEDFLIEVGAWNACYNDGGPSAEMTVDGEFVTNNSIGGGFNGRYTPNAIMLYSTAPEDNELVRVECEDTSIKTLNVGETFLLKVYGYNQYGEMVDDKVFKNESVEINIPDGLGKISSTGLFTASKAGTGIITINVKGHGEHVKIPVNIGNRKGLILSPNKIFTGEGRPVQMSTKYFSGTEITDLDPAQVSWTVDDKYVVSSCDNGLLVPFMDGFATVTATYQGVIGTASIEVENLVDEDITSLDLTEQISTLSEDGLQLPSVPRSIFIETVPRDQQDITLRYLAGDKEHEVSLANKGVGVTSGETITFDYDAADTYPVILKSLTPINTEIRRLLAVYTASPSGISELYSAENPLLKISRTGNCLTLVNCSAATEVYVMVYAFDGVLLSEQQAYLNEGGSCTLDVMKRQSVIVQVQTKNKKQIYKLIGE